MGFQIAACEGVRESDESGPRRRRRGADADSLLSPELIGDLFEAGEEGIDEIVELFTCWSQGKRATMEQPHFKEFLELENLPADCRLLDAVWHSAHGFSDAFKFGDVVKELEMMNVHTEWGNSSGMRAQFE